MALDVTGSRVFISAGAAGIGRAMVDTFVTAGAKVFTCDVQEDLIETLKSDFPSVEAVVCDCSSWEATEEMFGQIDAKLGGLDVLINNVGIAGPTARVENVTNEEWQQTLDVNITSHFYAAKLGVPMLKRNKTSAMINLSSVAGRLGFPMRLPYSASKWAVIGFTKTLAAELGPNGVRVNAILPGLVEGDRINAVIQAKATANNISFDDMRGRLVEAISLRSGVSPYDIANMALYLSSDLGAKMSGQAISVDGDVQMIT